jgi:HEAT repeat protein
MRTPTLALVCLACAIGSAAVAVLLSQILEQPAPRPQATIPDDSTEWELADMRDEIRSLRIEVNDLRNQPAPEPTVIYRDAPDDGDADTAPVTAEPSAFPEVHELSKRIERLELAAEAARKLRLQASLELTSSNSGTRRNAAALLAKLARDGDPEAKQMLMDGMKHENYRVRDTVIDAIGDHKLAEFIPALREVALTDTNATVRDEVAEALARMPKDEAGPILMMMLNDQDTRVLREAIDGLGDIKYEQAAGTLAGLAAHEDVNVAMEAALSMKQMGDTRGAEGLVSRVGAPVYNGSTNQRRRAMSYLRRLNVEAARPYFEQGLKDSDSRVKRDAQRGIAALDRLRK